MSSRAESQIAVATGFVFVFRSIGQVFGVGISGAVFQTSLASELRKRFSDPKVSRLALLRGTTRHGIATRVRCRRRRCACIRAVSPSAGAEGRGVTHRRHAKPQQPWQ